MPVTPIKLMIVIVDLSTGTGAFVRDLASGLRRFHREEFEVTLLTFRDQQLSEVDRGCFDRTHSLGMGIQESWRQMIELPVAVARLKRAIREFSPDVVLGVHTFSNLVSSMAGGEMPVILTDHLNLSQRQAARGVAGAMRWMLRRMYARRMVVGVSQAIVDDLRANFGATRTATILNGVDLDRIRSAADESPAVQLPERFIAAVGRLAPQKDIPTLLRAYAQARGAGLLDDLVLVGDGPDRQSLEVLADSLGITGHVHFVGHQANPFPIMKRARFLVMSSVYEGFGLVLVESMALGVPCISTDCPSGPAEILANGEFGLLVPVSDPTKLGEAMVRLSGDEQLRQEFSDRSLQRAEQLSAQHMARQYRDLIVAQLQTSYSSE